jgi:outer membrane protein TolC
MTTPRARRSIALLWLVAASLPAAADAADPELGLADAVRETLEANLDLAARRRALAADREEIDLARSSLLPQVDLGARAQQLDADRSDADRGSTTQRSLTLAAGVTQVLYDETARADFDIQKHVYGGQIQQLETFRLDVIRDAADAFLELDRARSHVTTQERNRELTRQNLQTSRARLAAGWSSEREILRWQSQLAQNDQDVTSARTQEIVSRFELNRVRERPVEAPIVPLPAAVEEYGFVYARDVIARVITTPEGDRRLRDLLVRVGLERSPDLVEIDEAIAAADRLLTANRRAFWVPSVTLGAGINHLAVDDADDSDFDFDDTEWTVGAGLTFPLVRGGAKFAELRQTSEALSALRIERRATARSIEQSIRAAFAEASGSYANITSAREQEAAARRNFELVNDSYVLGVASILSLLDAQAQLLAADQAVTDALYDFLEDLIAAERELALYPFLEPPAEVAALLNRLERELQTAP